MIARWAPGHLSSYYESKARLSLGTDGPKNAVTGAVGTNGGSGGGSLGSGSAAAGVSVSGGGESGNIIKRSRSSLRRQFERANQSYMHGASAVGNNNSDNRSVGSAVSVSSNAPFATYSTFE